MAEHRPGPALADWVESMWYIADSLAQLWGCRASEMLERACGPASPAHKLAEVDRALSEQLRHDERADVHAGTRAALARVNAAPGRWRIADLSDAVGMSRRRLEELFRAGVGLTPKQLQRLARFRRALETIGRAPDIGWSAFALDCGYYDQAHFSNEFRHHAGIGPTAYLGAKGQFLNHVPLGTGA